MATGPTNGVMQHLRRAVLLRDGAGLTDGHLLADYLGRRDEAALAALVRRHGPMVWGVCRRVLSNHHDAEDAFQATFLVLVRKAAVVVPREMVANWLYGVAHQTAVKARAMAARRKGRERQVAEMPEPAVVEQDLGRDLQPLLDEELSRLPDKYRIVIVLCDLEGKTRKEAARQLGCPEGTVAGRLARARALLAKRLARRGVALAGGALAAALSQGAAPACLPAAVVSGTIRVASVFAAGEAVTAGVVSAKVAALTEGVLKTMLVTKLKIATVLVLAVAAIVAAGTGLVCSPAAEPQPPTKGDRPAVQAKAEPKPAKAGRLLVWQDTQFVFLAADGKKDGELPGHPDKLILNRPVLSPDGKRVAFTVNENPPTDDNGNVRRHVFVRAADGKGDGLKLTINAWNVAWTPDGKALVVVEALPAKEIKDAGFATWLVDLRTKKQTRIELPKWAHPFGMTPDGQAFVAALYDLDARQIHLALVSRDGKQVTKLTELRNEGANARPSPDGTRILFQDYDPAEKPEKDMPRLLRLFVYDVKTKKRERLAETPLNGEIFGYCWSPDGKRVAYTWKQVHPGVPLAENTNNMNDPKLNTQTESHLIVADADGRNPKTIKSATANRATSITLGSVDWR